jgi:hypothetical protein
MGEYFKIVNPARRQYLETPGGINNKWSGVFRWDDLPVLELLLREVPPTNRKHPLIGAWAGDPVYVTGDYAKGLPKPWDTEQEVAELRRHQPDRSNPNLYAMACYRYEPITFGALQMLYQSDPTRFCARCSVPAPRVTDLQELHRAATLFHAPLAQAALADILVQVGVARPYDEHQSPRQRYQHRHDWHAGIADLPAPFDLSALSAAYHHLPDDYAASFLAVLCPPALRVTRADPCCHIVERRRWRELPPNVPLRNPFCLIVNQSRRCYVDTRVFGAYLVRQNAHGITLGHYLRDAGPRPGWTTGHWCGDRLSTLEVTNTADAPLSARAAEVLATYSDVSWTFYRDAFRDLMDPSNTPFRMLLLLIPALVRDLGHTYLQCPDPDLAVEIYESVRRALYETPEGDVSETGDWLEQYGVLR